MRTKLIIVEGMDNTGKSTLISRLNTVLEKSENAKIKIMHLTKPPKDIPEEEIETYMNNYYDSIIEQLTDSHFYTLYDYIILDRCHLSEYVYGPIYRNRNELNITVQNLIYEKKLINVYKDNIVLILLNTTSNTFLINFDDDKSLSNVDEKLLNLERDKFFDAYDYSLICNKNIYNVNKNLEQFNDVLPNIIKDFFLLC
jgi:thymidylate kinase